MQFVAGTLDRKEIVYASNQENRYRRPLWRVSPSGGPPEAMTSGTGIEWPPTVTAQSGDVASLASGPRTPGHAEVRAAADHFRRILTETEWIAPLREGRRWRYDDIL